MPTFPATQPTSIRNIRKLLIAAQLSSDERDEFARLFRQRVDDHRPTESRPDYAELLH